MTGPASFWPVLCRPCEPVWGVESLVHEVGDHAVGGVFEVVAVVHPDSGVVGPIDRSPHSRATFDEARSTTDQTVEASGGLRLVEAERGW